MAIKLRITKKKEGDYFQAYDSYFDKEKKQGRHKHVKTFGFDFTLKEKGIKNPLKYVQDQITKMNKKAKEEKEAQQSIKISDEIPTKNLGYFLLKSVLDKMPQIDQITDLLANQRNFQFKLSQLLKELIYAQVVKPSSKLKCAQEVIPYLFQHQKVSEDQIYEALDFLGRDYKKFIELFNVEIDNIFKRNFSNVYFDCTNFYFEIDLEKDDKQKGPSKENRPNPIIGQALLLDSDCLPIAMEMYPGNESEKPYIRKLINECKRKYEVKGKTIQVADKGLNCAKNIYLSIKNLDGYIFSKSFKGRTLSELERSWINNEYGFVNYYDNERNLIYKLKEMTDKFQYHFKDENGNEIKFVTREKRVVSYNPSLARKQLLEIEKQVEKAKQLNSIKSAERNEYGDSVKYVKFSSKDKDGKEIKISPELNFEKIEEDKKYAGYNLIVTSEVEASPQNIYEIYHRLNKIEESFRITKNTFNARPAFLQSREKLYGHFLINFLALQLTRLLEIKFFNNEVNNNNIIEFVRGFFVTKQSDGKFVNNLLTKNKGFLAIKKLINIPKIENLYLTEKDIEKILKFQL